MKKTETIKGLMVFLSCNQWFKEDFSKGFSLEEDFWDYILDLCEKNGVNTILLDVGDGVQYKTHPEISLSEAWSYERVAKEVKRCAEKGIKIIPKVNFSLGHCYWMKDYWRMPSTALYYQFVKDIIGEIYEMFLHPEYIHIGMDEEDEKHCSKADIVIYRKGKLYIHDLKFMIDTVNATGAKAMMWQTGATKEYDLFMETIKPSDVVMFFGRYFAFKKEDFTRLEDWNQPEERKKSWYDRNYTYAEDWPSVVNELESLKTQGIALIEKGFRFVIGPSLYEGITYNHEQNAEFFMENVIDKSSILGMISLPWENSTLDNKKLFDDSIYHLGKAMEMLNA